MLLNGQALALLRPLIARLSGVTVLSFVLAIVILLVLGMVEEPLQVHTRIEVLWVQSRGLPCAHTLAARLQTLTQRAHTFLTDPLSAQSLPLSIWGFSLPLLPTAVKPWVDLLINGLGLFVFRGLLLCLSLPLWALGSIIGLIDGMSQRSIRRYGGGRESAGRFYRTQRTGLTLFAVVWLAGLLAPIVWSPVWCVVPAGILGVLVAQHVCYFKKYG